MSDLNLNLSPKTPKTPHSKRGKTLSSKQISANVSSHANANPASQFTFLSPTLTPQSHKKQHSNVLSNRFKSPAKSTTNTGNPLYSNYLKTPEYTPKKINRQLNFDSSLSVLNHDDAISTSSSSDEQPLFKSTTAKFGGKLLFPIAHSTVGSGRTSSSNQHSQQLLPPSSTKSNILFDPFIQSEQDESDSNSESASPTMPQKRLVFTDNDIDEQQDEEYDDDDKFIAIPSTPGDKMITFEMAEKWNNNSSLLNKSAKGSEIFYAEKLENPFIDSAGDKKRQKLSPVESVDYSRFENEIELIDKKGNKIYRKLTDEEKNFKPKRLFFDQETPTTPSYTKESSVPLLNTRNDLEDLEEIINDSSATPRKTLNPFVSSTPSSSSFTKPTSALVDPSVKTTITYINKRTGQQKIVSMDQDQLNIKPKKLNFD